MKPLDRTVVLDLTHMLSGPFCTMVLADMGATTIKIEPPGRGEATRVLLADDPNYSVDGMGAYFMTLCRNKKSVAIDLKQAEGLALFYRLVRCADVVVDNFGPGVTRRLKIDFDALVPINPRIISCSVTGFGQSGPAADRTSFDLVAQGVGGGMSLTGELDGRALRAGIPIGDLGGGLFAAIGILAALQGRERTGRGQSVDISMVDCQVSLLNYMATMYLMSGKQPGRLGNGHFVHIPYDTFATRSRDLILAVLTDEQWRATAEVLDVPSLKDVRYATRAGRWANSAELLAALRERLTQDSCEAWSEKFERARVPCAPVNDIAHALIDPQVVAREMVVDVQLSGGRKVRMPGNPIKFSDDAGGVFAPPPRLGQDTDDVLQQILGLSAEEISGLRSRGLID